MSFYRRHVGVQAGGEKSGPFCPNPRSIITTRVFTTTQILLSRLSRNGLTSLYCLYHRGYKIVSLEVVALQSVEYSIAMYSLRAKMGHFFPSPLAPVASSHNQLLTPSHSVKRPLFPQPQRS